MTTPLACVFIAFLLIFVPKLFATVGMARQPGGYDNKNPRDQQSKLSGWARRAQAAHMNGFESFAPFAAGVVVAHLAGAEPRWSALLAVTYILARAIYPFVYIANLGALRSAVWMVSFLAIVGLFVLPWMGK